jgi:hypothetical protein
MAHMDEGTLQAYLDDEVTARAEIEQHLAVCTECAAELGRLQTAAQLFATAMGRVDVKAPTGAALAEVSVRRPQPLRVPRQPRRFAGMPLARAAMFVIGIAAVACAAIPGSPVRALIVSALRTVTGQADEKVVTPQQGVEPAEPVFDTRTDVAAALSIQPSGGRVLIVLTRVAPEATVRVTESDNNRATVEAIGAAAHARFRTGAGRIEVVDVPSGEVRVEIPRSALGARVEVDGKVIFQK